MKRIKILFAVIIGLVVLWSAAWLFVANWVGGEVKKLATPAPGMPAISCGDYATTGFPFRFDIACENARLENGDQTFELKGLKLTTRVYNPTHILAFAEGPLVIKDSFFASHQQLGWQDLEASLRLNGFSLTRFSAIAENPRFTDHLLGETLVAESERIEMHLIGNGSEEAAPEGTATLGLFARSHAATIPGFAISDAEVTAEAEALRFPRDVRDWQRADVLKLWQQAGGMLKLHRIEIVEPDANVNLSGDMALNEIGEVDGDLTLISNGLAQRLDLLLPPEIRDIFVGSTQADGSNRKVFTIRRGAALAGIVPIGFIPPLFF